MNVRHLAELAGVLSVHALQIVECPVREPRESLSRLAKVSSQRAEAWTYRIKALSSGARSWSALYDEGYDPGCPLIEEILVSEVLARVVAGLFAAQGQHQGDPVLCQFASALVAEFQESRRMALVEMIGMADAQNPAVRQLDRLRRLAERWTDILLGPLACRFAIANLTFEAARSQDYGQTLLPFLPSPTGSGIVTAGLRVAFPETLIGVPSHAGFHREMASAVLGTLSPRLFAANGELLPVRSFRSSRAPAIDAPQKSPRRSSSSGPNHPPVSSGPKLSFRRLRRKHQKP